MKRSIRLKHIESMITGKYDHIWDCCCDHGLLGASLLKHSSAPHVHFVDIVPAIIEKVKVNLHQFHSAHASRWTSHCCDVAQLPLSQYEGNHLVIIAGVSGNLTASFVTNIYRDYPSLEVSFLLCPVHQVCELRQTLIQLDSCLDDEALLEENQRFYEILLVSRTNQKVDARSKVHPVGELIWQPYSEEQKNVARRYLNNRLTYYQQVQQQKNPENQKQLNAYLDIQKQFLATGI